MSVAQESYADMKVSDYYDIPPASLATKRTKRMARARKKGRSYIKADKGAGKLRAQTARRKQADARHHAAKKAKKGRRSVVPAYKGMAKITGKSAKQLELMKSAILKRKGLLSPGRVQNMLVGRTQSSVTAIKKSVQSQREKYDGQVEKVNAQIAKVKKRKPQSTATKRVIKAHRAQTMRLPGNAYTAEQYIKRYAQYLGPNAKNPYKKTGALSKPRKRADGTMTKGGQMSSYAKWNATQARVTTRLNKLMDKKTPKRRRYSADGAQQCKEGYKRQTITYQRRVGGKGPKAGQKVSVTARVCRRDPGKSVKGRNITLKDGRVIRNVRVAVPKYASLSNEAYVREMFNADGDRPKLPRELVINNLRNRGHRKNDMKEMTALVNSIYDGPGSKRHEANRFMRADKLKMRREGAAARKQVRAKKRADKQAAIAAKRMKNISARVAKEPTFNYGTGGTFV